MERSLASHHISRPFPWKVLFIVLATYSALQVSFLGLASIAGSTEAREAQVIDTIVRENSWILPLRNGIIPSKPPLYHWAGAIISLLGGRVSEFSARLPSHIFALIVLACASLCSYRLARASRTFQGEDHSGRVALIAAGVLSLTYGFHQLAAQAMVDMTFSGCLWCALTAIVFGARSRREPSGWVSDVGRLLFWFFCALAVLARGPVGAALPVFLVAVAGLWILGFRQTIAELMRPSLGWAAFLLPVAWYALAYDEGGEAFVARQLMFENVQRFFGGERVNEEAWWFYIPSLLRTTFPWGICLIVGLLFLRPHRGTVSYAGKIPSRVMFTPFVVLCAGVALLSLSSGKRHSYMLPMLPLVAIQVALLMSSLLESGGLRLRQQLWESARKAEIVLALVGILILVVAGLGLHGEWSSDPLEDVVKFGLGAFTMRVGLVLLVALLFVLGVKKTTSRMLYASVWMLMVVLMTTAVSVGSVVKSTLKGYPLMAEKVAVLAGQDTRIVFIKEHFDEYFDPFFFYLHRPVTIVSPHEALLRCEPGEVYVTWRPWLEEHALELPGEGRELSVVQETFHALRQDGLRELAVLSCLPSGYPNREGEGTWQEAALSREQRISEGASAY